MSNVVHIKQAKQKQLKKALFQRSELLQQAIQTLNLIQPLAVCGEKKFSSSHEIDNLKKKLFEMDQKIKSIL